MSNVLGCICKDEVGSITEVEGNINSAKCVDILDNNRLQVVLKLAKQDNRHHCYLSTILSIRTGVPGALSSWKIH
jgi:hypothetical protein